MPKKTKSQIPGAVLQSFIDEYQINAFSLSKSLNVTYQTITNILKEKGRITVPIALRLGKFFGNSPKYWLDIQSSAEIEKLTSNKKFISAVNSIPKAVKTKVKTKKEAVKRKNNTLSEKRKKAAKIPGAKKAKGKK